MTDAVTLPKRRDYCDEKGREFFFDNAKFILIFFVVLAHAISPLKTGNVYLTFLWRILNVMHMPCLIFISGYFAKRYIRRDGINVQRPVTYIILYLAAQLSVGAFEFLVLKNTVAPSIFSARSSLWFLQCLIWWYLLLPVLDRFKPKHVMIFVIALGLVAGYDSKINNFLAFSRMLAHLPFFMAGYYMTRENIGRLFTAKARLLSIPALLIPAGGLVLLRDVKIDKVIVCSYNFWDIPGLVSKVPFALWWGARAWFYVSAALLCFAFLVWVPRTKNIFTRFGSRTLQVYILHRFLYLADLEYKWYEPFKSTWGILAMIGIAAACTIILSLKPFSIPFDALQSIKIKKLLKPADVPQPAAAAVVTDGSAGDAKIAKTPAGSVEDAATQADKKQ